MKLFEHNSEAPVLEKLTRASVDGKRIYQTPSGEGYPSVTTVLGILGKEDIQKWRDRVGHEEANRISTQAARRGTAVHKLCEDYLDNDPDYSKKHMPANIHMFNTMKPILDERINNIWYQECFLYSNDLQTAGQVDCIAEWDGVLSIVDYKTSRRPKKREYVEGYFIQEAAYAAMFLERTGVPIKQIVTVIAVDDNEPQVFVEKTMDHLPKFVEARQKFREKFGF